MTGDVARTYPHGVTCWIDLAHPDVDAAAAFYGGLLGWTFAEATPPGAASRYLIASLDGRDAAGLGGPAEQGGQWSTYVAVDDVDAAVERLTGLGARLLDPPADAGEGGRAASLVDPQGAEVRLWQARARLGVQAVNEPGAWNFSDLRTSDVAVATRFYGEALGWRFVDQGWATSIQVPGYGDHLEATVDPDIRTRQAHAPEGFEDVIGSVGPLSGPEAPHWHVTFTVADRDASVAAVERLGGTVETTDEDDWTRSARVRDPQGAVLTLSQFAPQGDW